MNADMQIHINGDVMMAIKQYLYATGDLLWLEHEGAPHPPRASVCTRSLTHRLTRPPSSLPYSVPPVLSLPLPPALLFVPDGCEPSSLPPPNRNGALVKPSTATQPLAGHDACLVIAAALSRPCCAHASLQCCPSSSTSRGFGRAGFTVAPTGFITSVRRLCEATLERSGSLHASPCGSAAARTRSALGAAAACVRVPHACV